VVSRWLEGFHKFAVTDRLNIGDFLAQFIQTRFAAWAFLRTFPEMVAKDRPVVEVIMALL